MSVSGTSSSSTSLNVQSLVDTRLRLDELQRQLGTGTKSADYAGVGLDRGLAVGMRQQLSTLASYTDNVTTVDTRIDLAQTVLTGISTQAQNVRSAARLSGFQIDNTGQTQDQKIAKTALDAMLGLLNSQFGDRYLFAGRATDQPAVESTAHVLDGDTTRAGLKQIIAERNQADLGSGLGRLLIPPVVPPGTGTAVSVSEDVAGSPFGFKLAGVSSTLTNATVTGPAGTPPAIGVDFAGGNPNAGDTLKLSFNLPDGSTEDLTLTATTATPPGTNEFTIGASPAATAANLQAALTTAVGKLARTSLSAASAMAAADNFFNMDGANPPQRVAGPPFATATSLTAATPANTVFWYTGEAGSDPARGTAVARADQSITVAYGLRANEQAIRKSVQQVAVFAAVTFTTTDPDARDRYAALSQKTAGGLDPQPGQQKIVDISADLATAHATLDAAKQRHAQTKAMLEDMLQHVEGISQEEVAAQLMAVNTRLQASLQTTALLSKTTLVNYL